MGKAGLQQLKATLFHQPAPPTEVGPTRHRIGLVMFFLPFVQSLLETWASHVAPQLVANRVWIDIIMDAMLVASLFVLGGNCWNKPRALFFVGASAVVPARPDTIAAGSLVENRST